ncbi:DinB family protein [Flavobacterium fluviatile]|uniref:DinB family protein n=1 Tax=Flavobacterium fluviatile TaxID=1862387 RepID=UPI0013D0B6B5|nr:DinB family protein [Flavobacterium fluviatile]
MKKILLLIVLLYGNLITAQDLVNEAFVEKWDNSKTYLLDIVKMMPEEKLDYKPTQREMSFKDQIFHILDNMSWLSKAYFTNEKHIKIDHSSIVLKEDILKEIEISFDKAKKIIEANKGIDLSQKVEFFAGPKTKLQILNLMQDHVTHHRGQLIVYLNLNQIQPPKYIGW